MNAVRKRRLFLVLFLLLGSGGAIALVLKGLGENLNLRHGWRRKVSSHRGSEARRSRKGAGSESLRL